MTQDMEIIEVNADDYDLVPKKQLPAKAMPMPMPSRSLLPSQEEIRYLISTDEDVFGRNLDEFWVLTTRHLELMQLERAGAPCMMDMQRQARDIIRTSAWSQTGRTVPYHTLNSLEFYGGTILASKSIDRGERTLLATQINRSTVETIEPPKPLGLAGSVKKFLFGK